MWVHATLMDSVFHVHQQVFGELSWNRRQDYYEESRRFARLFGVPDEVVPPDVDAFSAYMRHMLSSDILAVGPAGLQVRSYLFQSDRAVLRPAWRWYECMTSGLLPPRLREEFSMPWGRRNALVYRAGLRSFAAIVPRLPAQLRYLPAYLDACERLAGRSGRDPVARAAERLLMGILARS